MSGSSLKKSAKKAGLVSLAGLLSAPVGLSVFSNKAHAMVSIIVSGTVDLNFGALTESGAGGTVKITTAGTRTTTGSVTTVPSVGAASQGKFSISGSTGLAIDLSVTASKYSVLNGASDKMTVSQFNLVTAAGGSKVTVTLAANPSTLPLGGTLVVGTNQPQGTYIGTYILNAAYQ